MLIFASLISGIYITHSDSLYTFIYNSVYTSSLYILMHFSTFCTLCKLMLFYTFNSNIYSKAYIH